MISRFRIQFFSTAPVSNFTFSPHLTNVLSEFFENGEALPKFNPEQKLTYGNPAFNIFIMSRKSLESGRTATKVV
jgi:hypothetical protein